jgi:2-haloacid dehalogenase
MPSSHSSLHAQTTDPGRSRPRAVLFDAYGTLFDVYSVAQLAEELFPGHGQAVSVLWRDKQIEYTRLVTASNHGAHYQPFSVLTRAALIYAIKKLVVSPDETLTQEDFLLAHEPAIAMLLAQYQHLEFKTHPEAYALGEQATGLDARDILFVSSNAWDALGATWSGYTTLWVNRYRLPFEELGTQPSRTGADLRAVLDFFNP